jgi:hypothetical protein
MALPPPPSSPVTLLSAYRVKNPLKGIDQREKRWVERGSI